MEKTTVLQPKTLAFFASPHPRGHCRAMLDALLGVCGGEVSVVSAHEVKVSPCIDCQRCWREPGCAIADGMQDIYAKIDAADRFVFATPVYFDAVPAQLKCIVDRCQIYWAGKYRRNDLPARKTKRPAALLFCGGAPKFPGQFLPAQVSLERLLGDLGASCIGVATQSGVDRKAPGEDVLALEHCKALGELLNRAAIL